MSCGNNFRWIGLLGGILQTPSCSKHTDWYHIVGKYWESDRAMGALGNDCGMSEVAVPSK